MPVLTFTCEVLTPMFLNGADGQTPELRAPSIKGALRFWWRALNGHMDLPRLRQEELQLFGGVGPLARRSSLILSCRELQMQETKEQLVPHKNMGQGNRCFRPGSTFEVTLRFRKEPCPNYFFNLFVLTGVFGGLGKRSRRGMGSWRVLSYQQDEEPSQNYTWPQSLAEIHELIKPISPYYVMGKNNKLYISYSGNMAYYPWLDQVRLGRPQRDTLKRMSIKTHDLKQKHGERYNYAMGHVSRGRFASPVCASMLNKPRGEFQPIFACLNTIPGNMPQNLGPVNFFGIQGEFMEEFL